jgi:hypothetical protein
MKIYHDLLSLAPHMLKVQVTISEDEAAKHFFYKIYSIPSEVLVPSLRHCYYSCQYRKIQYLKLEITPKL